MNAELHIPRRILPRASFHASPFASAFTLIEILVVCGIIGIIMTISIPMIYRKLHPDSMQKVVTDITDGCSQARAFAILQGNPVDFVIRAEDGQISLQPAAPESAARGPEDSAFSPSVSGSAWRMQDRGGRPNNNTAPLEDHPHGSAAGEGNNFSGKISDKIAIELIEINFQDAMDWAEARVRFYPNGTCDEFKMLLYRPDTNERRLITLEVVTALVDVESDVTRMR